MKIVPTNPLLIHVLERILGLIRETGRTGASQIVLRFYAVPKASRRSGRLH